MVVEREGEEGGGSEKWWWRGGEGMKEKGERGEREGNKRKKLKQQI